MIPQNVTFTKVCARSNENLSESLVARISVSFRNILHTLCDQSLCHPGLIAWRFYAKFGCCLELLASVFFNWANFFFLLYAMIIQFDVLVAFLSQVCRPCACTGQMGVCLRMGTQRFLWRVSVYSIDVGWPCPHVRGRVYGYRALSSFAGKRIRLLFTYQHL